MSDETEIFESFKYFTGTILGQIQKQQQN